MGQFPQNERSKIWSRLQNGSEEAERKKRAEIVNLFWVHFAEHGIQENIVKKQIILRHLDNVTRFFFFYVDVIWIIDNEWVKWEFSKVPTKKATVRKIKVNWNKKHHSSSSSYKFVLSDIEGCERVIEKHFIKVHCKLNSHQSVCELPTTKFGCYLNTTQARSSNEASEPRNKFP